MAKLPSQISTKDLFSRGNRNHIKIGSSNFSIKNTMTRATIDTSNPEFSNEFSNTVENLPQISSNVNKNMNPFMVKSASNKQGNMLTSFKA